MTPADAAPVRPAAIIFDCDGVLVDSEPIAARVMSDLLAEHRIALSTQECMTHFVGMTLEKEATYLREHFGIDVLDVLNRDLTPRTIVAFERELRALPGVAGFLASLRLPIAVASSSRPERVAAALRTTGLAGHFGAHVYTAAEVAQTKPAPDLYLYAAARLGIAPRDCLAIEDSLAGVQAAFVAGMTVLGFTGATHIVPGHANRLRHAGATGVFDSWPDLARFIGSIQS